MKSYETTVVYLPSPAEYARETRPWMFVALIGAATFSLAVITFAARDMLITAFLFAVPAAAAWLSFFRMWMDYRAACIERDRQIAADVLDS